MAAKLPQVKAESSFDSFLDSIPKEYSHFPNDVLEQWIYEHGKGDGDVIKALNNLCRCHEWTFKCTKFTNEEILTIRHYPYDEKRLFPKANNWIRMKGQIGPSFYHWMMENGTFPRPIIVAHNANDHKHPILKHRYGEDIDKMFAPYHLLEGNRRLALLRAMIEQMHCNLKEQHSIWLVTMS